MDSPKRSLHGPLDSTAPQSRSKLCYGVNLNPGLKFENRLFSDRTRTKSAQKIEGSTKIGSIFVTVWSSGVLRRHRTLLSRRLLRPTPPSRPVRDTGLTRREVRTSEPGPDEVACPPSPPPSCHDSNLLSGNVSSPGPSQEEPLSLLFRVRSTPCLFYHKPRPVRLTLYKYPTVFHAQHPSLLTPAYHTND